MAPSLDGTDSRQREALRRTCLVDAPWYEGDVIAARYQLKTLIGEGGMGLVFRAQHLILDQPIALKLVKSSFAHNPMVVGRFLDEARAIARLTSPHVVHVFDSGTVEDGTPYMALELLNGQDLHSLLMQEGPLPFELAARYVSQACHAVAEAHSLGIIHRDLKPENLFLHRGLNGIPIIKVLDFGVSKHLRRDDGRSHTVQGETVGSPHYMAPEQMAAREVDERTDVWSLGVVLFELVTGRLPFEGDSFAEVYRALLEGQASALSSLDPAVPPAFENAVNRCLRKDPAERYARVGDLAEALSAFCDEAPPCPSDPVQGTERPTLISVAPRGEPASASQQGFARRPPRNPGWIVLSLMAVLAGGTGLASVSGFRAPLSGARPGVASPSVDAEAPVSRSLTRDTVFAPVQVEPGELAAAALKQAAPAPIVAVTEVRQLPTRAPNQPHLRIHPRSGIPKNDASKVTAPRAVTRAGGALDELIAPYEDPPELRAQAYDPKR